MLRQDTKNMLYYTEQHGTKDALSFCQKQNILLQGCLSFCSDSFLQCRKASLRNQPVIKRY